ncbi:MAG: ABC transporter ATP-binding protein, partial [Thermoleophilaceae bacterium]
LDGLPDGYETRLGRMFHEGHELSIGEWQRVALARSFFRDAPLMRMADRIYVLEDGEVVQSGTHEELMTAGGLYADLFGLQAASYSGMA